ncbi:Hypp62 [Branchiostoma lanceolatum]|uniref:Hypp62 protein n=1 Tax=Branchiostoma lanceolatum TaxID=7740 RepID=A0A8J9YLS5_BRALA|nr:Hypp62 [Branchiostoma lanceolatum]
MADVETAVPEEPECQEAITGSPVITHASYHRRDSDYMIDHSDPMLETAMPDEMEFAQVLAGEREEAEEQVEIPVEDIPVGKDNQPEPEESNVLT